MVKQVLTWTPVLSLLTLVSAQDADCAPGGNFDLSHWSLQLPTGGSDGVDTISNDDLEGCEGYTGETFYTGDDGSIVMTAPGNPDETGCVTTSGSDHCRTEFRELDDSGSQASWSPGGTNTLSVTMTVVQADDSKYGTAIGQVFAGEAGKPLLEMYYNRDGEINAGVKSSPTGDQVLTPVGKVAMGEEFEYVLSYSDEELSATINGEKTPLDTMDWDSPNCYFKAGNYNQGQGADSSEVHISAIEISHS